MFTVLSYCEILYFLQFFRFIECSKLITDVHENQIVNEYIITKIEY